MLLHGAREPYYYKWRINRLWLIDWLIDNSERTEKSPSLRDDPLIGIIHIQQHLWSMNGGSLPPPKKKNPYVRPTSTEKMLSKYGNQRQNTSTSRSDCPDYPIYGPHILKSIIFLVLSILSGITINLYTVQCNTVKRYQSRMANPHYIDVRISYWVSVYFGLYRQTAHREKK